MSVKYAQAFSPNKTPQSEPMRADQVKNSAGGYTWAIDDWQRLERFLVLGCEGNTFYADQKTIVRENAQTVIRLIKSDGVKVVARIEEVSQSGKAFKNDAALFALALCFVEGDNITKAAASAALPNIARIGTFLFTFVDYVNSMRGWGRALKNAVGNWYQSKPEMNLAYDLTKYRSRGGWSHRDLLRKTHVKTTGDRNLLYRYAVGKLIDQNKEFQAQNLAAYLTGIDSLKLANNQEASELIRKFNYPREVLPTELLTELQVWEALLESMPMTAMIRNLATMTRVGLVGPLQPANQTIKTRLTDRETLRRARIHPLGVLAALLTYSAGHGVKGNHTWAVESQIVDALDAAFYLAFDNVEPTQKRTLLALDVSDSMTWSDIGGIPGLTPMKASAVLALVTAAKEPNYSITAFTSSSTGQMQRHNPRDVSGISVIDISPRQRLDDVIKTVGHLTAGGTDCSLPMRWALANQIPVDTFQIYTDYETWAGPVHPAQALQEYRSKMNIPAKLVTIGMQSNGFTIADPTDNGMMDVVGFSTDTPAVIADFARG